jgi:large subunit ribosomal protein L29
MDIDKVRALTDAELADELASQRRHLYDLRFQLATRQLTDYSQLTQTRRSIARILTVATEREATGSGPIVATPKVAAPRPAAKATPKAAAKRTADTAAPAGRTRRASATSTKAAETATRGKK